MSLNGISRQYIVRTKFEEATARAIWQEEMAWKELKEGIAEAASQVCGVAKRTKCGKKRWRWWNEEVKKQMYRRLLDTSSEEAKREYNEAKVEAKRVVRRIKHEEWVQGRLLEMDVCGNQRRFWARVSRRMKAGGCIGYRFVVGIVRFWLMRRKLENGGTSILRSCMGRYQE